MSRLPVRRACELELSAPEHQWLIEQLWGGGAVGIIGGEPKSYKSFLALGMSVAVASGRPCLGRFPVPRPGRVLLFAAEDALHIVRERIDGICAHEGVDVGGLDLWVITAPVVRLDVEEHRRGLRDTVAALRPALLVLDPLVRLHRVDENVSAAIAPLLAFLRELQRDHDCAVVLVHHAKKGGSSRPGQALRGSSELHAWGDSNLYVQRRRAGLVLSVEQRAHPAAGDFSLVLHTAGDGFALVAQELREEAETTAPSAEQRVIAALRNTGQPLGTRELRRACRIRAASLSDALRDLHGRGVIERVADGWDLVGGDRASSPT